MNVTQSNVQDAGNYVGEFASGLFWPALPWILLGVAVGLATALMLVTWIFKRRLLHRHQFVWSLATNLSYVAILLALPVATGVLGGVYGVQKRVNVELDALLQPVVLSYMPAVRTVIIQGLRDAGANKVTSARDLLMPLRQQLRYLPTSDRWWERMKAHWVNDIVVDTAVDAVAAEVETRMRDKLAIVGAAVAGDSDKARLLAGMGIAVLMHRELDSAQEARKLDNELGHVIMLQVKNRINGLFPPLYSGVLFALLALTLLIALEIWLYRRYFRPQAVAIAAPIL